MDERIWTIAEILDKSGPMTADELAAQLKLSGKTVRSLIKTYAKEMQENGFCITAKPGRGFGIEITDAQTYVSGSKPQQGAFPRTCGGDPDFVKALLPKPVFSPHMRG